MSKEESFKSGEKENSEIDIELRKHETKLALIFDNSLSDLEEKLGVLEDIKLRSVIDPEYFVKKDEDEVLHSAEAVTPKQPRSPLAEGVSGFNSRANVINYTIVRITKRLGRLIDAIQL